MGARVWLAVLLLTTVSLGLLASTCVSPAGVSYTAPGDAFTGSREALHPRLEILKDLSGLLSLDDVRALPYANQFSPYEDEGPPSFSYTAGATWIRFQLTPPSEKVSWLLEIGYPLLDDVTFFRPDAQADSGYSYTQTGDSYPFRSREFMYRTYIFELPDTWQEGDYFYVRVATNNATIIPVVLWNYPDFITFATRDYLAMGMYYGVVLMVVIYYLFLFFYIKEIRYLYTATFVFSMGMFLFVYNGLAFQYLWPDFPWWGQKLIAMTFFWANASGFFLAASLLPLKQHYPGFSLLLRGISLFALIMIPASIFLHNTVAILMVIYLSMFGSVFVLVATFLSWSKKHRPSRYLFWGWLLFTAGIIIISFRSLGMVPDSFLTIYGVQMGFIGKLTFLAMGLADYQNRVLMEKEQMEEEVKRQTTEVQLAQTAFLFAQMKPHFLLNALNTVVYFVGEKPEKAKQLIFSLSTYLRRTFDFREIPSLIPLDDEMELVLAYAEIEEARFPEKFTIMYEIDVLPETKVPPFSIQPLVENALVHGIRSKEGGFSLVRVICKSRRQGTVVAVTDNGVGFGEDRVSPLDFQHKSRGIGLWNIDRRLRSIYGSKLNIRSRPDKGSVVWYIIPKSTSNKIN